MFLSVGRAPAIRRSASMHWGRPYFAAVCSGVLPFCAVKADTVSRHTARPS